MATVQIKGLSKSYRKVSVLKDVNIKMEQGLFGLLGPNGAGKTTLMKILSTALDWDEGSILIYQHDLSKEGHQVRELLGYLPQHFHAPNQFTGREFLHYVGSMKGIIHKQERTTQIERLLKEVNLLEYAHKKIKGYSGGMKRRLGIAQALLGNPKLIILDEPTAGLDPSERIRFRNLIEKLSKNHTIILSTHIISDIESSCENVAVLNQGEVLFQGTTKDLTNCALNYVWELPVPYSEYDVIEAKHTVISNKREEEKIIFRLISKMKPDPRAILVQPTIEDGYMAIISGVVK